MPKLKRFQTSFTEQVAQEMLDQMVPLETTEKLPNWQEIMDWFREQDNKPVKDNRFAHIDYIV